jgi:hypothetical protein
MLGVIHILFTVMLNVIHYVHFPYAESYYTEFRGAV